MKFTKMHGCANDYIYIDCTAKQPENIPQLAVSLSDRHTGIGGDGIVLICKSDIADFKMRMFNADGSEGAMCGNAIRCVGKYVYDRKLTAKTRLNIETLSGVKRLDLSVSDGKVESVTVNMGKPVIRGKGETEPISGVRYSYTDISMGNPHCVIFIKDVLNFDVAGVGRRIENMTHLFPDRTNVEFAEIIDSRTLRMRVWERGSGETMACGTGACACVAAAIEQGKCQAGTPVTVLLNGGSLEITLKSEIFMTGPAEFVFDGEIEI